MQTRQHTLLSSSWEWRCSLLIYLLINSLFVAKYLERTGFPVWIAVSAFVLAIPALLYGISVLPRKVFTVATITLAVLTVAGILIMHRAIDPLSVQVDRWSAIDHFLQRLLKGEYPYLAQTHLGGYGSPFERDPDAVAVDVRKGFVSLAKARTEYRVVLDDDGHVDTAATRNLRQGAAA